MGDLILPFNRNHLDKLYDFSLLKPVREFRTKETFYTDKAKIHKVVTFHKREVPSFGTITFVLIKSAFIVMQYFSLISNNPPPRFHFEISFG